MIATTTTSAKRKKPPNQAACADKIPRALGHIVGEGEIVTERRAEKPRDSAAGGEGAENKPKALARHAICDITSDCHNTMDPPETPLTGSRRIRRWQLLR